MSAGSVKKANRQQQRSKRRFSVISRLAGSTALLAAAVVLLAIVFSQTFQGNFFKGAFETPLEEWSTMMANRIGSDREMARSVAMRHQLWLVVFDEEKYFAYGPTGEPANHEQLQQQAARFRRIDVDGPHGEQISIFMDDKRFANSQLHLLAGLIVLLLVVIAVIYAFQLSQLRPLLWLREGVDSVSRGDFSVRVPVARQDEIGQVGQAFNHMTRRVEKMLSSHEQLMADVSHELRSPLARIKVALELMPHSDKRDAIARDVLQMESLTSALLERERIKNIADNGKLQSINLTDIVSEIVERYSQQPPGVVYTNPPASLNIQADTALISVLVQNLIDNAVKFSLTDSKPVEVRTHQHKDRVQLIIEDDGQGIASADMEKVFEPFVKLDLARGHRGGYGLGLNLCQRIADAVGGSIQLSAREGRGVRIEVLLPVAQVK